MACRKINNRQILGKRQQPRSDADPLVVTQAGAADRQEVALKHHLTVYGRVRLIHQKKQRQRAADQRDVKSAADKTQPRRVVTARDQQVDNHGKKKRPGRQTNADQSFLSLHREKQRIDHRYEQQQRSQR